mmetsp:Transcript_7845/g.13848  ORF Transcript_7845/g.13848 Transcript_7845/m.13848 type:complete len:368 (+) Transcript_7845:742-1845(+)|eukprot:CAMPEP_0184548732 /NCGR_PEP_ID=MMETSP0199_2-20130426/6377_1 /TAXON_ID=1112570 /ORGANISM="Thraustochytrium sp., Strain LLF1b" /LENGTH=367 /DNA_ID=CAMNT_0026943371 /DNA_START=859 /DNA_END=1962 /DNA_ORIENTATION=+
MSDDDSVEGRLFTETGVYDREHKSRFPDKSTAMKAMEVETNGTAPAVEAEMDRDGKRVDPVRTLSELNAHDQDEIKKMDMDELAEFFHKLGLRELPDLIVRNSLNGSVLGTMTPADIERMDFHSLGEAKGFQALCNKMQILDRGAHREEAILVRKLIFWGYNNQWFPGPCDGCNCCAFKNERDACQSCCDSLTCSPLTEHRLPEPSVILYRDHLSIQTPMWKTDTVDKKYHELNRAFADPNVETWRMVSDNIDYSNITDVDVDEAVVIGEYRKTCVDCKHILCCKSLRREPHKGQYYWITCFQKCCGYNRTFKERPSGVVTIRLNITDERGATRKIGVMEESKEFARTLLSHVEEAQIHKGMRVNLH